MDKLFSRHRCLNIFATSIGWKHAKSKCDLKIPHHKFCTNLDHAAVRVRFAPSPTGQLHLGGLRTALYNYLFAKANSGTFILRIEDTDQTRAVEGSMEKLKEMLVWTGIEPDEGPGFGGAYGPYIQSQRMQFYQESIKTLLNNESAYHCFCTSRRLELLRKDAARRNETPKYDNRCRHLNKEEVKDKLDAGEQYCIRFKLEPFKEPWQDLIFGPIKYDVAEIEGDPVIIKTDGFPTYHFANVVDDHFMEVSHVLRGLEWQVSTTKHLLIYKAFGWTPPQFGHLPLLLNSDGSKLSKRQGAIHVEHFKKKGYFPEAVLNLLTSVGSGFKVGPQETVGMDMSGLIQKFDVKAIRTNSTHLDLRKIDELNQIHFKNWLSDPSQWQQLANSLKKLLIDNFGQSSIPSKCLEEDYIKNAMEVTQDRIALLTDYTKPEFSFIWVMPDVSQMQLPDVGCPLEEILATTLNEFNQFQETMDKDVIQSKLKNLAKDKKVKYGLYMKLLRLVLSGLQDGPPVGEMMKILGKKETESRLQKCLNHLHTKE